MRRRTMKAKHFIGLGILLAFLLTSMSCKRAGTQEPSPFGPASFYFFFELTANPNILFVTTGQRQQSEIRAVVRLGGKPAKFLKVYFYITAGLGEFADLKTRTYVLTDENGVAKIMYLGPLRRELANNDWVTIEAQPQTSTPFYLGQEVEIRLILSD
jgi:hypothetical protein